MQPLPSCSAMWGAWRCRSGSCASCCDCCCCRLQGMRAEDFSSIMAVDKKVQDGQLRLILLQGPMGGCTVTGDFDPQALQATLQAFCSGA